MKKGKEKENEYRAAAREIKEAMKKLDPYLDVLENDPKVQKVVCQGVARFLKAGKGIAVTYADVVDGIGKAQETAEKDGKNILKIVTEAVEKREKPAEPVKQRKAAGRIK